MACVTTLGRKPKRCSFQIEPRKSGHSVDLLRRSDVKDEMIGSGGIEFWVVFLCWEQRLFGNKGHSRTNLKSF